VSVPALLEKVAVGLCFSLGWSGIGWDWVGWGFYG